MQVRKIVLKRDGDYDYGKIDMTKPLIAEVTIEGAGVKTSVILDASVSAKIISLIADEMAAASRATISAMTGDLFRSAGLALPAPPEAEEAEFTDAPVTTTDDEIPF